MGAAGSSSSSWFLLHTWLVKSLRQPLGSRSGVAMESFLKSTKGFSSNALVDKDDEEETQALPAKGSHKPSSSSKLKKEKFFISCDPQHDIYTFSCWQIFWHPI